MIEKTGHDWNEDLQMVDEMTIVDPDGWDRSTDSYETELISKDEFVRRMIRSSIQ